MIVKELTNKILDNVLVEFKRPDNIKKIQIALLDPLINYTYNRMFPYFSMVIIIFIVIHLL